MTFKSNLGTQQRHLNVSFELELYDLSNTKVGVAKDQGKNYIKVRSPLFAIFTVIVFYQYPHKTCLNILEISKTWKEFDDVINNIVYCKKRNWYRKRILVTK